MQREADDQPCGERGCAAAADAPIARPSAKLCAPMPIAMIAASTSGRSTLCCAVRLTSARRDKPSPTNPSASTEPDAQRDERRTGNARAGVPGRDRAFTGMIAFIEISITKKTRIPIANALSSATALRREAARARDRQAEEDRKPGERAEQHRHPERERVEGVALAVVGAPFGIARIIASIHRGQAVRRALVVQRGDQPVGHAGAVFDVVQDVAVDDPGPGCLVGEDVDVDALPRPEIGRVFDVRAYIGGARRAR